MAKPLQAATEDPFNANEQDKSPLQHHFINSVQKIVSYGIDAKMKKSTFKLLIFTFIGILVSCFLYTLESNVSAYSTSFTGYTAGKMHIGIYIAPFVGLIYWLFTRKLED